MSKVELRYQPIEIY